MPQFTHQGRTTSVPVTFEPHQSFFVVFPRMRSSKRPAIANGVNFPKLESVANLEGSWDVAFDPKWGGPEEVSFKTLQDWTKREERGIKYYSGIATYQKSFNLPRQSGKRISMGNT